MRRADLRRFHDIAATSKTRGEGIGFAGVGIKLGLLVSDEVVTETQRSKDHLATTWALHGRQRAPWRWITPPGLVAERGTAVRLHLTSALSPLLDAAYVESTLRRHFEPLLDAALDDVLAEHYPRGVRFSVNGSEVARVPTRLTGDRVVPVALRIGRRRKPSAFGYLVREELPLPDELRGVAICTYGKVIKRGWDWLGIAPSTPEFVRGVVEAPALAACLATSGPKRPVRLGLSIQLESRSDDPELGRLVESTIWVNDAHPAYRRAVASRSEGYHYALTVAMALSSIAVEPPQQHAFVTAFLERWGEAASGPRPARRGVRR
jgi:hypothetical protein